MGRYDLRGTEPDGYTIPPGRLSLAVERRTIAQAWLLRGAEAARGPFCRIMSRIAVSNLGWADHNFQRAAAHLIPCSPYSGRPIDLMQDLDARRAWEGACEDMGIPRAYCR